MKTLLVMRHAKSSWSNAGMSDFERPLNNRGQADAPRMGKLLRREDLVPDLIITSTAKRAWQTAEAVAYASGYEEDVREEEKFYLAAPVTYINVVKKVDDRYERVMVVGHNPGISELITVLTGAYEGMPTAAIGVVTLPIDSWSALSRKAGGDLKDFWVPREVS
ncbi:MAG TPA: histidine phosphatase family protein [Anaerolineae bacterium]|nr:histidine phosphatase family protein [Anaerolineae bacterium]